MTTTAAKTTTHRALPWLKFSADVDAQIAARTTPASIEAAYQAYLAGETAPRLATTAPRTEEYFEVRQVARPSGTAAPVAKVVNGASEKQARLIDNLISEKVHTYTEADVEAAKADWRKTRTMIDTLIKAARKPYQAPVEVKVEVPAQTTQGARLDFSAIPDGNYALPGEGAEIKFYRVTTNGQWKNVQVRASDTLFPAKGRQGIAILHKIVEFGLAESQMLFATKLERCWMCGRSLTHEVSRARGTGDECASK